MRRTPHFWFGVWNAPTNWVTECNFDEFHSVELSAVSSSPLANYFSDASNECRPWKPLLELFMPTSAVNSFYAGEILNGVALSWSKCELLKPSLWSVHSCDLCCLHISRGCACAWRHAFVQHGLDKNCYYLFLRICGTLSMSSGFIAFFRDCNVELLRTSLACARTQMVD